MPQLVVETIADHSEIIVGQRLKRQGQPDLCLQPPLQVQREHLLQGLLRDDQGVAIAWKCSHTGAHTFGHQPHTEGHQRELAWEGASHRPDRKAGLVSDRAHGQSTYARAPKNAPCCLRDGHLPGLVIDQLRHWLILARPYAFTWYTRTR